MVIELDLDVDIDGFEEKLIDAAEKQFVDHVEKEFGDSGFKCQYCEARSFDVKTWQSSSDGYEIVAVCRECNERLDVEIDTSEFDDLR